MAETVKVEQLASAINSILADYQGLVQDVLVEAVDATAKETVADLRNTSPKRTGAYAKGWTQAKTKGGRLAYGKIAYNKPHYRLTHLLEYGHATRNGGRTKAQPHIAPAEAKAVQDFEHRLREGIKDAAERA